jgi:integrase
VILFEVRTMASISKESGRDSWKLSWRESDGRKKAIRLGSMPKKSAEQFRVNFERLLEIKRAGDSIPQGLGEWLRSIDAELRERLVGAGLVEPEKRLSLGRFCEEFLASRKEVAPLTAVRDRQVVKLLIERFGSDRRLDSISVRDAEEWRSWLKSEGNKRDSSKDELAENTVRRRTGVARQIFATAIRWEMIQKNPFDGLVVSVKENLERRVFVSWGDCLKVIEQAPGVEWRALIAFIRLIGCRVPSELNGLTWADVDFVSRRILIRSPKTKHHGGEHVMRSVPLFPELLPYLEALAESVGVGMDVPLSAPVFPMAIDPRVNLRTGLSRMIVRAGLSVWDKLFVNLRSSRETELLAVYPATDVCRWMGHSPAVAAKFYAQARPEIADRAAQETTVQTAVLPVGEMGGMNDKSGSEMGSIGDPHGNCLNPQTPVSPGKNGVNSMVAEGPGGVPKPGDSGRRGTRTPDIYFVRVAL